MATDASVKPALFSRFVQIGRVVLVSYGPEEGKLATIIDIVDASRVLVDGPEPLTGLRRQIINLKWVSLTDLTVKINRNARQATLVKAWAVADVLAKWKATAWAKKRAGRVAKLAQNDFERFVTSKKRRAVAKAIKAAVA